MTMSAASSWCRRRPVLAGVGAVVLALLVSGCGPSTGDLSGKVLQKDGTPLPGGVVTFYPERGNPASATIQADGGYEVKNVAAGPVKISVSNDTLNPKAKGNTIASKAIQPPKEALQKLKAEGKQIPGLGVAGGGKPPGKYVPINKDFTRPETSGLTAEVQGGEQKLDVKLPK
jgi:hypothetical protein